MDRLALILTVAQSGLTTAAKLVAQRAKAQTSAANKETNPTKKEELVNQAKRSASLAKALSAADSGITAYLEEE